MQVKTIYYCKKCILPYRAGRCVGCRGLMIRDLEDIEEIYKRSIIKLLQSHRAEFFNNVETEKRAANGFLC